ncbi:MAG: sensor histidine kinase [Halolamina sp.]
MEPSPYEIIVENFPGGVVFVVEDRDGLRYTFVGGKGLAEIGLSKDTLEGQAVAKGRPEELQERIRSQYRNAIAGEQVRFEVEAEGRHFRIQAMPVGEDGSADAAVGILQDITEQVVFREELVRQNERLERFTELVFHDIRSPLNVAKGRLQLVREDCDSEHIEPIADALDRIEELTSEDTALVAEAEESFDPVELPEVARLGWQNVVTKDAALRVETDRTIHGDEPALRRLFENLYRNAVEHGGEDVTVTVGDIDDGFYVADDGTGIPAEKREMVFERGTTHAEKGTGLGLFIVKNVVEAHGWSISVTESADGGARFEITGIGSD